MKRNLFRLLPLCITLLIVSCAKDDPFEDDATFETADLSVTIGRSTTPCAKSLASMVSGSSLDIGCVSDLSGKTINIPKGADIKYDGGTILNGTLHFDGGTIDGRLLNKDLKITGTVKLANSTYTLDADQWGMTEGWTSDKKAFENRVNLNEAIDQVHRLGGTTFKIGKLDAYFEITEVADKDNVDPNFYEYKEAIQIPSNMHLQLSDETKLHVQRNNSYVYALVAFDKSSNAKLSGGKLYGDRDYHNFNGNPRFPSHEWGYLVLVHGARNSRVENVSMYNANGDALKVDSENFTFESNYHPSKNITISGCTIDNSRRNGLTLTGGEDIIVENNSFIRTGQDTNKSKGTNPRFAIDVEAQRDLLGNGQIKKYQEVDGVIIRNNTQKRGARGGFLVSIGENVTIENNQVENGIGYKHGQNTIIRNNHCKARIPDLTTGIYGGDPYADNTQKNNKVYGNTVEGYRIGMSFSQQDHQVHDNKVLNCEVGITAKNLKDTKIYNNTITSDVSRSKGIFFFLTTLHNVEIENNNITTKWNPINLIKVNENGNTKGTSLKLINNTVHSPYVTSIKDSKNIDFERNTMYVALEVFDSENIVFNDNMLDAHKTGRHTIDFRGKIKNMTVSNNDLTAPKYKQNTKVDNRVKMNQLHEWGNSWNYK